MKLSEVTVGYKVHDGESWERPISAPLIWRAIKHATEVEGKKVWSNIAGATGKWTIRYSTDQPKEVPLADRRYFYVRVKFDVGGESWFEIIPEDDDVLELHPDKVGGYEVQDPAGKFKT